MRILTGHLHLDDADAGAGLEVRLRVDDDTMSLTTEDEILGTWTSLSASAEQISSERFRMSLGEESVVFAPDDPIEFKYEVLPALAAPPNGRRRATSLLRRPLSDRAALASLKRLRDLPTVKGEPDGGQKPERVTKPRARPEPKPPAPIKVDDQIPATTPEHEPPSRTVEEEVPDADQPGEKEGKTDTSPPAEKKVSTPQTEAVPEAPAEPPKPGRHRRVTKRPAPTPADTSGTEEAQPRSGRLDGLPQRMGELVEEWVPEGVLRQLRKTEPEEHDHSFERQGLPGGLIRSVCTVCGQVSIDLTEERADRENEAPSSLFSRRITF